MLGMVLKILSANSLVSLRHRNEIGISETECIRGCAVMTSIALTNVYRYRVWC